MSKPLLSVENIETYYGPIMAIRGISFQVAQGSIVTILGSNGAGKTTILKTISGAIDPRKGKVFLNSEEIQKKDPDKILRMGMSHAPEGREVFPYCSVLENLQMGAYTRNNRGDIQKDIDQVYDYFPILKERKNQPAGLLSGGEQQMVAIGRALMSQPETILLDEPSMGLAPQLVEEIFEIVKQLNEKESVAFLLAEQNTNVALKYAHKGYILESGRVVMDGPAKELRENPDVAVHVTRSLLLPWTNRR